MRVVFRAFAAARGRLGVRICQWSAQRDHLHLLIEPDSATSLSRGVQGLCIRLAKGLNRVLGRRGRVFGERYHAVRLGSPRQARRALAYVLLNRRHHAAARGERLHVGLDACSSAPCFDGWTSPRPPTPGPWTTTVLRPATWLLLTGWKRYGLVDPLEVPGGAR
jgi:hypothetical protein